MDSHTNPQKVTVFRLNDDECFNANEDILSGFQFFATLHLTTPLSVLVHHGEVFSGPPSKAPQYGNRSQGIWLPKVKTWRELGIDLAELPEFTAASDVGPILASQYLPFVCCFRRIIESDGPRESKLAQLRDMAMSPQYSDIWGRATRSYARFPDTFV